MQAKLSPLRLGLAAVDACVVAAFGYRAWQRPAAADGAGSDTAAGRTGRPVPVIVAPVLQQDTPVYLEGLGGVEAFYTAVVKSQVDGRIDQVLFAEGQQVRRGDVLVQIDPRPFDIALHAAVAALARDEATLKNNRLNMERNKQLLAKSLVSTQTVTDLEATVEQYEATVLADRAAVDSATLQLAWCRITAPIAGQTGVRLTDPGNLVHANDANGLVVITQLDPIAVLFTLPEDDLPQVARGMAQKKLQAQAFSRDGKIHLGVGEVTLIDNQINASTGTMRVKAVFKNAARALWPNQFVRIQLHVDTLKGALLIPAAALQHGPHGDFVYGVAADNTAHVIPVNVTMLQGEHAVLAQGPAAGSQVVIDGQYKLHDGAAIAPTTRLQNASSDTN